MKAVGGGNAKSFPRCVEGKPGGGKAQEGRGADGTLNRFRSPPHSPRGDKALKSRARRAGAGHTAGFSRPTPGGHERAGETRYGSARGTIPWRANPGRGCGAKQTRKAGGGANRRGRVKRRGRNVARGRVSRVLVDAACWCRDEGEEPQGRRFANPPTVRWSTARQVAGRRTLKEATSSREDETASSRWRWTADGEIPRGPSETYEASFCGSGETRTPPQSIRIKHSGEHRTSRRGCTGRGDSSRATAGGP